MNISHIKWKKLGQLYSPKFLHPNLATHAANPLPILLDGDVYRIFFSGRDNRNRSSVGFVDVNILQRKVVYIHDSPVFEYGADESFYSHGVSIGNLYEAEGRKYILFMGWHVPSQGHWYGSIGRLILNQDFSLELDSAEPLMPRDEVDPISLSYPWVIADSHGYHMWYGSTVTWDAGNGEMLHVINYANSTDGRHWRRAGVSVPYQIGVAQAFSRPSVIREAEGLRMWFSYRSGSGTPYRIGCATGETEKKWELSIENSGIDVSPSGWDSEMIEYPFVFEHKGERYMLYNGNGYGETGFGIALMEEM